MEKDQVSFYDYETLREASLRIGIGERQLKRYLADDRIKDHEGNRPVKRGGAWWIPKQAWPDINRMGPQPKWAKKKPGYVPPAGKARKEYIKSLSEKQDVEQLPKNEV